MSEVGFLLKQLEYCLNCKYQKPAQMILKELILLRAQVSISVEPRCICVSHKYFYKEPFENNNFADFTYFPQCAHFVCHNCMQKYIRSIFERVGMEYQYVCPGCFTDYSNNKTPLDPRMPYFLQVVSEQEQRESMYALQITYVTLQNACVKKSECYFAKGVSSVIRCKGQSSLERLPCLHLICQDCFLQYLHKWQPETELKCFSENCNRIISHIFIKDFLIKGTELYERLMPVLQIPGMSFFICPCGVGVSLNFEDELYNCPCGYQLCCKCGCIYHGQIPCFAAKGGLKNFKRVECREDDAMVEYRNHFYNAQTLFEWDLNLKKKKELQLMHNIKLKVTKVEYIYNPILLEKYNAQKKKMINNGVDPCEVTVFHGTSEKFYSEICQNGFKIGGVDIDVKIGQAYGFGIYTATDPTMSVHFYKNKKIILCKAMLGLQSGAPINTKQEFLNTQYNSFIADFRDSQSNYYIFFQRENLLPLYYIEYD